MQKKINIITLGCSKNTVDSEKLASLLNNNGFSVYHNSNNNDFEIAVVNTCGFINDAKEESIEVILSLVNAKSNSYLKKIVVFGCLSERYFDDIKKEIPEIDVLLGNFDHKQLLKAICGETYHSSSYSRVLDNPGHYAYIKISEGCNRKCAFCAIPLIKGKYKSREIEDIILEAEHLANSGVKEIMLIAQDLSYYGLDIYNKLMLAELTQKLSDIQGIEWIRLHYLYPFGFPNEIIKIIANNPKVCNYIDIPLQHISDKMLKLMKRGGNKKQTIKLLDKIRKQIPDVAIRTSILTGHPGETKSDFTELLNFIQDQKFERLGVFTYSKEEGTSAARLKIRNVSEKVKNERMETIMQIQQEISYDKNALKVGKTFKVIIDSFDDKYYYGRTEHDSVEVDNSVIIKSQTKLQLGSLYNVKITSFGAYELYGDKID